MFEFGSHKGPEVHSIILRQHSARIGSALQISMATNVVIYHPRASVAQVFWSLILERDGQPGKQSPGNGKTEPADIHEPSK